MKKIWQIVRLKRLILLCRFLIRRRPLAGSPAPVGYAALYVGYEQRRRFEIPARYLNLPVIAGLLEKAEEEFGGAQPPGGLSLPCDPVFFRWILDLLSGDEPRFRRLSLEDFSCLFDDIGGVGGDFSASASAVRRSDSCSPLLQAAV
ncbi:hypothetical protein KSP39_PZI021049 [Platanthera zijinensis]|uniref:Small auxin up regulated protein n=1 Tax=Platanthera zijinensis TaxID=2320716 RepID=A0AAP0AWZ2_9ASPA